MENKIENYFQEVTRSFRKLAKTPAKKLGVEGRHDLRVLVRREQAVIKLIKSSISKKRYKSAIKGLKKLEGGLGRLRELDVAKEDAKTYGMNDKKLGPLKKQAKKLVKKKITPTVRSKLARKILTIQEDLEKHTPLTDRTPIVKLRDELGTWLSKKSLNKKELHLLRILIKKTRYTLEAFSLNTDKLVRLQDALGKIHDLETLEKFLWKNSHVTQAGEGLRAKVLEEKDEPIRSAMLGLEGLI